MPKERIRRKDIKQPDEFITLTAGVVEWVREHRQSVTWAAGVVVVLLAVVALASAFRAARQRDASIDLGRALEAVRSNDLARAASELEQVATRWSSSLAGQIAAVLAADTAVRRGELDAALTAAASADAGVSGLPVYIRQQHQFVWGVALEGKEQWSAAADKYSAANSLSGPYRAPALLGEARVRERAGEADKARALYRRYVEEFPDMPGRDVIEPKLKS